MIIKDFVRFSLATLKAYRGRSFLTSLGIAVGIAAVVLLTSIGEGIHQYVLSEFTQFGSNLIAVNPGRVTTLGTPLGVIGSVRPLSIDDADALVHLPLVENVVPVLQGNVEVGADNKRRRTTVYGVGHALPELFRVEVQSGRFLPQDDPHTPRSFAVLGSKLRMELFGSANPLGQHLRIGGQRYIIIGAMAPKGQFLGFDLDDTVFIPTAKAQELFNREGLMEIDVLYKPGAGVDEVVASIKRVLMARHGHEDFTITTQQQMLDVLGKVLNVLTVAVSALGGISLLVGGVGILTIMTIAVRERTSEIGLLRALGAHRSQLLLLFLGEAAVLSGLGGIAGLGLGIGSAYLLKALVPALPVYVSAGYVLLAEGVAIVIGLLSGILPAVRAANLNPIEALRYE